MENKSFKEAMERLDIIVSKLEQNDVELEEAIQLFDEGLQLVKSCDGQLKAFEDQVSSLIEAHKGEK